MPGGVSSPVRSLKHMDPEALVVKSGKGSKIYDVDGNEYVDYVLGYGPEFLGHSHEKLIFAAKDQLEKGFCFGITTELELELAKKVCKLVPSCEMLRFCSSGTEATQSALRLARAYTEREKVLFFSGGYHGHSDSFLRQGQGLTQRVFEESSICEFDNLEEVEKELKTRKFACVLVEPVQGNRGVRVPTKNFLQNLKKICEETRTLLIFDEVMTGFRISKGGAQEKYGVEPDLTCFGKIIGGGLPVGGFGGKREIMENLAPEGKVYHAGTNSGNPLTMKMGFEMLNLLEGVDYFDLKKKFLSLRDFIRKEAKKRNFLIKCESEESMLSLQFLNSELKTENFDEFYSKLDNKNFSRFFSKLLREGVNIPPNQLETWFLSTSHSEEDLNFTKSVIKKVFQEI